jgi:hypothetical protein
MAIRLPNGGRASVQGALRDLKQQFNEFEAGAFLAPVTIADATTIEIDWRDLVYGRLTLEGNRTLALPTNGVPGTGIYIEVTQDATGGRTLAFASGFMFAGKVAPVLSTAAGAMDVLFISCRSTTSFVASVDLDVGEP